MALPRSARRLLPLALVVVTAAAFWPVVTCDFVDWDDQMTVAGNGRMNPPSLENTLRYWRAPTMDIYIPLTYTVWEALAAGAQLPQPDEGGFRLNPYVFHLANLTVHVLTVLAVYGLLKFLLVQPLAAAVGAMLFAVHPVQVESVAWVSGMKDLLCGLFSVLAVWQYVVWTRGEGSVVSDRSWRYAVATIAYVLAMLSKPTAMVVPLVAWVLDLTFNRRGVWRSVVTILPWVALAVPCMVVAKRVQPAPQSWAMSPVWARPLFAGDGLAFYLYKLVWPAKLGFDYGRTPKVVLGTARAYYTWVLPAVLGLALFLARRRVPAVAAGAAVFVAGLLPVLGLVPFDFQRYSNVADHYLYLPMLGVGLAAGWVVGRLNRPGVFAASGVILLILAGRSWAQAHVWQNTRTLFAHDLTVNPDSYTSLFRLAADDLAANRLEESIAEARAGLAVYPDDDQAHHNLGMALAKLDRIDQAIAEFREAIRVNPKALRPRRALGDALAYRGRYDEAIEAYQGVLDRQPSDQYARAAMQRVLEMRRRKAATTTTGPSR
jgi:cytochrome c-type biogenesis protein CcmH/NrfG